MARDKGRSDVTRYSQHEKRTDVSADEIPRRIPIILDTPKIVTRELREFAPVESDEEGEPESDPDDNSDSAAILAGAIAAAATPTLAVGALNVVGFSSIGPVAGSLAALIQAQIGSVAAGSVFAAAQGIAMGAAMPVAIPIAVGGTVCALYKNFRGKPRE